MVTSINPNSSLDVRKFDLQKRSILPVCEDSRRQIDKTDECELGLIEVTRMFLFSLRLGAVESNQLEVAQTTHISVSYESLNPSHKKGIADVEAGFSLYI